jgi:hypothetical protein
LQRLFFIAHRFTLLLVGCCSLAGSLVDHLDLELMMPPAFKFYFKTNMTILSVIVNIIGEATYMSSEEIKLRFHYKSIWG